jgi:superfamily II DNA or RNA helicase
MWTTMADPIELREDQTDLVTRVGLALKTHQSVLAQAPTGFGKTVMAGRIARGAEDKGKHVIFGCHRRELAIQTAKTFDRFGIRYSFIAAGMGYDPFAKVHIASANTLANRRHHLKADLLVADEARLWASDIRSQLIVEARGHGAKVVGLDATPERLDGRSMRHLFDHMERGPSVEWLMEQGHLSRYRLFTPVRPDFKGLHKRGGDFIVSELEEKFDKPSIIGDAVKVYQQRAMGLRTIAFAFSRKHGKHLADTYRANGIHAVYIDGDTDPGERRSNIEAFANHGGILVNVELCIEGFDLSSQIGRDVPVEAVSLQRPTESMPRAKQMIGRALRKKDMPAVIMDHVGIVAQHGYPEDEYDWDLDGREARQAKESEKAIPTFRCGSCFYTARSFFRACPDCKTETPMSDGRKVKQEEGELVEVDLEAARRAQKAERSREQGMARTLDDLAELAVRRGYKSGWVSNMMKARGQTPPPASAVIRAMERARA